MMHLPGHLREAFTYVVDEDMSAYVETFFDAPMPIDSLLDKMSACTDVMPGDLCDQLLLPRGCNYANGVGALLKEMDMKDFLARWDALTR